MKVDYCVICRSAALLKSAMVLALLIGVWLQIKSSQRVEEKLIRLAFIF